MTDQEVMDQTREHILEVRRRLKAVCELLDQRGVDHDASKLGEDEFPVFLKYTPLLADMTYGSDEYKECLKQMKPALNHHYLNNRHHPEHYPHGIDGMTLLDIVEMLCDWKAATLRHKDGDICKSIRHNKDRFKLSPQLIKILLNTVYYMGWVEEDSDNCE